MYEVTLILKVVCFTGELSLEQPRPKTLIKYS